MPEILTLNKIAPVGLAVFPASYTYGADVANPVGILVRSASLHETALPSGVLAIGRAGAGVNNIPVEDCAKQGVAVFNTPGANANGVKELVLAGLFLAARKVADGIAWAQTLKGQGDAVGKQVEKGKAQFGGTEILGKTLGVIGLGAIGRLVADAAAALGMTVVGYDPHVNKTTLGTHITVVDNVAALYAQSDYVTLHIPLTAATKKSVDAAVFAQCKRDVKLLNFSRDALVNTADLRAALESGQVGAYIVDFPTDDVLGVPGVTAIPHLGASTEESEDNCAVMAAQQLLDYIETGAVKNAVNLPETGDLPKTFAARVTVVYANHEGLTQKIHEAFAAQPTFTLTNTRGDVAYTVADFAAAPECSAVQSLPGVYKVRLLQN
jgi:D-3-phosphoglycerate dehydrogenase